ncbi:hypothetical protein D1013_05640 [Euzebyella marina]|uniref:Fibronectin type-III domain-containing protein n=2 Tax=Euzebyella marina TaxID=1761453 RepID=A0A3G2L3Q7_9FLAO|nr:carboxypeptidase regulatory-like domain-containing protein [Euzebyella marina]AYN66892.1 hypothetical protein D1013_05640 [Euzebyella marina]
MNIKYTHRFILFFMALAIFVACEEETIGDTTFGKLEGRVVSNSQNVPLENVKITTNPSSNTVFTDAEGNFTIDQIAVGDYSVQAEKDDFQTSFEPASILSDQSTNVVFELDSVEAKNLTPLVPELIYPEDGTQDIQNPVEFIWSSSDNDSDTILYELELRNGDNGEIQLFENLTDTVLTVSNLSVGANYFWQVSANDEVTEIVQSKISSFQLRGVESNRFAYVRNIDGNNVIFSGAEPTGSDANEVNENEVRLTSLELNSFRPKANKTVEKIAYISTVGGESHLFTMNLDGSNKVQITKEIPIAGFRQNELEFTWSNNGNAILYPSFNKLYSVNLDGSGTQLVYETGINEFISEVASNPANNLLAIKSNNAMGYEVKIQTINPSNAALVATIVEGELGAYGGLDYSIDGTKILYTHDVSSVENSQYRQLDSRIFEYNIANDTTTEIDTEKPSGFNNLDAKYAPNEGHVIYVYTSNDGFSEKRIYRKQIGVSEEDVEAELLFVDAFMPNWE